MLRREEIPPNQSALARLPNDFLLEDASNLALVVDDIKCGGGTATIREYLQLANEDFQTVHTRAVGGTMQLFIE